MFCAIFNFQTRSRGLSDYNPESIFRSLAGNVYHYPPSVILAKGCHRLIHSYAFSLQV